MLSMKKNAGWRDIQLLLGHSVS